MNSRLVVQYLGLIILVLVVGCQNGDITEDAPQIEGLKWGMAMDECVSILGPIAKPLSPSDPKVVVGAHRCYCYLVDPLEFRGLRIFRVTLDFLPEGALARMCFELQIDQDSLARKVVEQLGNKYGPAIVDASSDEDRINWRYPSLSASGDQLGFTTTTFMGVNMVWSIEVCSQKWLDSRGGKSIWP